MLRTTPEQKQPDLSPSSEVIWYLYMLRTANNRLYTGITTDIERRFKQHQSGKGAKALRGAGVLTLVYQQKVGEHSKALKLEYKIKRLTKADKERIVTSQVLPQEI